MGYVKVDVPHLMVVLHDDHDLLWRLDEIEGAAGEHQSGNAGRLAGRARRVGDFAGEHLVIVLLHDGLRPFFQIGVGEIADAVGWLFAGEVGHEGMSRVLAKRTG